MGVLYDCIRQYAEAIKCYERFRAVLKPRADQFAEALAHNSIGVSYQYLKQYEQALYHHEAHLAVSDLPGQYIAMTNIGCIYLLMHRPQQAEHYHKQALAIAVKLGSVSGQTISLANIGNCTSHILKQQTPLHLGSPTHAEVKQRNFVFPPPAQLSPERLASRPRTANSGSSRPRTANSHANLETNEEADTLGPLVSQASQAARRGSQETNEVVEEELGLDLSCLGESLDLTVQERGLVESTTVPSPVRNSQHLSTAKVCLAKHIELGGSSDWAWRQLGHIAAAEGRFDESAEYFGNALKINKGGSYKYSNSDQNQARVHLGISKANSDLEERMRLAAQTMSLS
jgi:tetratricopeptide (TPR) repeat protein